MTQFDIMEKQDIPLIDTALIDRLREYRCTKNLTYKALAKEIGVTIGSLFRWMRSSSIPNARNRHRIMSIIYGTKK